MTKRATPSYLEPYLLFLLFVGVGLGTVTMSQAPRLAILWATLALLTIVHWAQMGVEIELSLPTVGRGALLGALISLPLLAFFADQLQVFAERLYATEDAVVLFYQVCFVSAPVEEGFFRGVVQPGKGTSASIGLYAAAALLLFLPHAPFLVALIVFLAMGILGIVYTYVRDRYGLAASIACHVTVGLVLQVIPSVIATLRRLLL